MIVHNSAASDLEMAGSVFDALRRYLLKTLPDLGALIVCEKLAGGQSNPTFKLTCEEGSAVLRRKPPGVLLQSAHAIDREYRVLQALRGTSVPVGRVYAYVNDASIIGSEFYVMEFIPGRVLADPAMPDLSKSDRSDTYRSMVEVLVSIHAVDVDLVGLDGFGRPGNYFERQIRRWTKQYRASEMEVIPEMEALIDRVTNKCVADDGRSALVHGDYRLDNVMLHSSRPEIIAVMDWELSTIGHPFADLAYQCMQWRLPHSHVSRGLGGLDRSAFGIPSEQEYLATYCDLAGIDGIDEWEFYLLFSFFRLAAIAQGIKMRAIAGRASDARAQQVGAMVQQLASQALSIIGS